MTRDRILKVAHRVLKRKGPTALSLRQVAGEVGVTPMAIYRHFKDKDHLLDALVGDGFAKWEQHLAPAVRADSPWQRIEGAFLAYADFALKERRMFELMFMVPRSRLPTAPASLSTTSSPSFGVVVASMQQVLGTPDVGDSLLLGWSAAHGVICLHFSGRFGFDAQRFHAEYGRVVRRLLTLLQLSIN
jgi:AcrR family transcriptional regulator